MGNNWQSVNFQCTQISVSSADNQLWAVKSDGTVFRRTGVNCLNPVGTTWEQVDGSLAQISVGLAGVWGIGKDNNTYYRTNTSQYEGYDEVGTGWIHVPGSMRDVTSGNRVVWATDDSYDLWARQGLCYDAPTGTHWEKVNGKLMAVSIDTLTNALWGRNDIGKIYKRNY